MRSNSKKKTLNNHQNYYQRYYTITLRFNFKRRRVWETNAGCDCHGHNDTLQYAIYVEEVWTHKKYAWANLNHFMLWKVWITTMKINQYIHMYNARKVC